MDVATAKVADIVFRDDLYPRIETSAVTVQKYAEDLSVLPPIVVNQHAVSQAPPNSAVYRDGNYAAWL